LGVSQHLILQANSCLGKLEPEYKALNLAEKSKSGTSVYFNMTSNFG